MRIKLADLITVTTFIPFGFSCLIVFIGILFIELLTAYKEWRKPHLSRALRMTEMAFVAMSQVPLPTESESEMK